MFTASALNPVLQHLTASNYFYIAYSGGLDSHVLLHAIASVFQQQNRIAQVRAIHINHGWSSNATQWSQHCQHTCEALGITCEVLNLTLPIKNGESLEAMARTARYAAFADFITADNYLLTAHQQDDQTETLFLQLFRGAGIKGLACMPSITAFANGYHLRPLLSFSRADLLHYALKENLNWIEDESNMNLRFDRNYVRHSLLPIIKQRWPEICSTVTRSASHCANAQQLIDELADSDLQPAYGPQKYKLSIQHLCTLSEPRLYNALRRWLHLLHLPLPSTLQLQQLRQNILLSRSDRCPQIVWDKIEIRRYREYLYIVPQCKNHLTTHHWDFLSTLELSHGKVLNARLVLGQGVRASIFPDNKAMVCFRKFGERCQPLGRQGSHPLKKLFQEWGVPPWERNLVPLIYRNDELVAVVNYCICTPFEAAANELGWIFSMGSPNVSDKLPSRVGDNVDSLSAAKDCDKFHVPR